ncbi:MAG: GerMN domain-containing protein [Brevinematia bacterium]
MKKKKKKGSKLVPVLWILTLALFVVYFFFTRIDVKKLFNLKLNDKTSSSAAIPEISRKSSLPSTSSAESRKMKVKIYLAKMAEKFVSLFPLEIEISYTQSPLKDTLISLINYRESEYLNLIPINTKINNVWIKEGFAHIDFSDDFNYNSYGVSGYNIQIYQVVYTATQFEGVKGVYFYINGKMIKYLGGEGFIIQNPVKPYTSLPKFSF